MLQFTHYTSYGRSELIVDSGTDFDCLSTICFTVENANELIEKISDSFKDILRTVKCTRALDLDPDMFKKPNKDKLAEWLVSTCDTLWRLDIDADVGSVILY